MMEQRARKKRWKIRLAVVLIVLMFLALAALAAVKLFTVKTVKITGNDHCPEETVKEFILNDEYSWNSLYVYFKYKFVEPEPVPFVDTIEVSLSSPHVLNIKVYEKGLLGCVYMEALGQNAYFDKDGLVVEMSSEVIEDVPKITGLEIEEIVLYEKLPIKGKNILKNLLSLTQTLRKYELVPESIKYGKDGSYTVSYGGIKVSLGQAEHFNEKIVRMAYIIPQLKDLKGTLHLENWTENTTDISFKKAE